jgi:hypothetical protein
VTVAESFNWWTDVIVPFGAALIGGGFAILGGLLAARYEASRTKDLALQLRAHRFPRAQRSTGAGKSGSLRS